MKATFMSLNVCLLCLVTSQGSAIDANRESDFTKWDIAGVRLGVTSDEVLNVIKTNMDPGKYDTDYIEVGKNLSVNNIMPNPGLSILGVVIRKKFDRQSGVGPSNLVPTFNNIRSRDEIKISYSTASNNRVVAITREISFSKEQFPSIKSTYQSLIEKFGIPDVTSNPFNENATIYYWRRKAKDKYSGKQEYYECEIDTKHENIKASYFLQTPIPIRAYDKSCGIVLAAKTAKNLNETVSDISFRFIDYISARDSYDYVKNIIEEKSAAETAKKREAADMIKPKF